MKITITISKPAAILRYWKWGLLALLALAVTLTLGRWSSPGTEAAGSPPVMSLEVKGAGADCDSNTQVNNCVINMGSKFIVSIDAKKIPAGGYVSFQSLVTWSGQLTYQKRDEATEIKWPDGVLPLRSANPGPKGPNSVAHADITGFFSPYPVSTFAGNIVNLEFYCDPALTGKGRIELVPYDPVLLGAGSLFVLPDISYAPTAAALDVTCQAPAMSLDVKGDLGLIDCNAPSKPTKCDVPVGSGPFTVSVEVNQAPSGNGYVGFVTTVDYDTAVLRYKPRGNCQLKALAQTPVCSPDVFQNGVSNVEVVWPDPSPVPAGWTFRIPGKPVGTEGTVVHAATSCLGNIPPFVDPCFDDSSTFVGNIVELEFNCLTAGSGTISLNAAPGANVFIVDKAFEPLDPNQPRMDQVEVPVLENSLTINCFGKRADPADTDGDGCSDVRENGSNPMQGGLRNWLNRWDFYDVDGSQDIDVPNDILQVILAYLQGPLDPGGPGPNYSPAKDRGPAKGGALYAWQRTGPDGKIDPVNDLLPAILQYLHRCKP